ncbi:MAG TPA: hypothetical protein VHK65_09050 [Candidatus Dormibacteraeota bacterium]|nr:hypothetical protein [Candidatus Dormibacteraeota bacterium]
MADPPCRDAQKAKAAAPAATNMATGTAVTQRDRGAFPVAVDSRLDEASTGTDAAAVGAGARGAGDPTTHAAT